MKTGESKNTTRQRAEDALRSLLSAVSTIKLKEISYLLRPDRSKIRFIAHVEVFGHTRELACEVRSSSTSANLRKALDELRHTAEQFSSNAAPVLIAPSLAPEAQAICKECSTGFLDLEGNARISVGGVFIGKRTLALRDPRQPSLIGVEAMDAVAAPPRNLGLNALPCGVVHSRQIQHSADAVAVA